MVLRGRPRGRVGRRRGIQFSSGSRETESPFVLALPRRACNLRAVRRPSVFAVGGAALLAGYALVLFHHTSFAAGGSDSSGYLNGARLLARGRVTEPVRGLERLKLPVDDAPLFIPLGYRPGPRPGTMSPSYPPGLSLHMAAAAAVAVFLGGFAAGRVTAPDSGVMGGASVKGGASDSTATANHLPAGEPLEPLRIVWL